MSMNIRGTLITTKVTHMKYIVSGEAGVGGMEFGLFSLRILSPASLDRKERANKVIRKRIHRYNDSRHLVNTILLQVLK
jgi:hypothetical protein